MIDNFVEYKCMNIGYGLFRAQFNENHRNQMKYYRVTRSFREKDRSTRNAPNCKEQQSKSEKLRLLALQAQSVDASRWNRFVRDELR